MDAPDAANYDELIDLDEVVREATEPPAEGGEGEPKPASEPKPGEPPKVAAPAPAPAPAAPPAQPAAAPAAQPPAQPPAQPQPAAPAQPQPGAEPRVPTAEDITRERDGTLAQLTDMYKFSDAEAAELLTNPDKVIPSLAAKLHLGVFETTLQVLGQQLPNIVRGVLQQESSRNANWNAFIDPNGGWPELNKPEYFPHIVRAMQYYRSVRPDATLADYVREVGPMVMMTLGLSRQAPAAAATPQPPAPRPHTPANPGGAAAGAFRRTDNEFEVLAREFEDLDRA